MSALEKDSYKLILNFLNSGKFVPHLYLSILTESNKNSAALR